MEAQIHHLEQEAYFSVLRAFKAQSDALTWDKEGLITELRKELRVSDDEHRELLGRVNNDDVICRIREWRQGVGHQAALLNTSQSGHDLLPSPTFSASRKKQKTSLSQPLPSLSTMKPRQYPTGSVGSRQFSHHRGPPGAIMAAESAEAAPFDSLVGRKLWTRWPEDNNFYEAVVTRYNPADGRHELVYDINTPNATYEWVDFKEIPPEDIRWEGEDPGIFFRVGHSAIGRGLKRSVSLGVSAHAPVAERVRGGSVRGQSRTEYHPLQNGIGNKVSDDIEIYKTDILVKEVEKVLDSGHPDPLEIADAKNRLKEHEEALVDAIARLADASDGESDGERPFLHRQSMVME